MLRYGLALIFAIVLMGVAFYTLNSYIYEEKQAVSAGDYKDAEYIINGDRVTLVDGRAEVEEAPGSASKIVTQYFGNEISTDLDKDGRDDVVFLITQEGAGSGIFYYVVAALNTDRGYIGSEAFFLGDRIAPQTTEKGDGNIVIVNYANRLPEEPFSSPATVGESIWLVLDPQSRQFGEVEQNFEGEADPSLMSLDMKTWTWVSASYNDGREIQPLSNKAFTLTFSNDGTVTATTDCNSMSGNYTIDNDVIVFSEMRSTKMYCENSQESEFASLLEQTESYHFTSRGELVLNLTSDSGYAVFR